MKFKLCAVAAAVAAGLATPAQAATSVTLYGLVDLGVGYESVEGPNGEASRVGMHDGVNSSSRFGLKGTEDLGDGLQAAFVLEGGFNPATGDNSGLFDRQATVALKSDSWGQLQAGRDKNFGTAWVGDVISPFGTSFESASSGSTFSAGSSVRYDNLLSYTTPSFGGFQLGVGYSFETSARSSDDPQFATNQKDRALTTGLRYSAGPLYLAASYDQYRTNSGQVANGETTAGAQTIKAWQLGGKYDFEVVELSLAFGQVRDGWFKSKNMGEDLGAGFPSFRYAEGFRANSYLIGLSAPLGSNKVFAAWQAADPKNDRLGAGTGDETMNVFSIGMTHSLSKRTNLYAYGSYGDNWAFVKDAKNQVVAVGIRHKF